MISKNKTPLVFALFPHITIDGISDSGLVFLRKLNVC